MARKLSAATCLFALMAVALYAVGYIVFRPHSDPNNPLSIAISDRLGAGDFEAAISELADFDWDEVCGFERADDSIKPDSIREYIKSRNLHRDDYLVDFSLYRLIYGDEYGIAFLFIKDGAAVNIFRLGRSINEGRGQILTAAAGYNMCGAKSTAKLVFSQGFQKNITYFISGEKNAH